MLKTMKPLIFLKSCEVYCFLVQGDSGGGGGGEGLPSGTYDDEDDDLLVDEENEIVEHDDILGEDVDVIDLDSFDNDTGNDTEISNYKRRRQKVSSEKEGKDRVYLHFIKSRRMLKLYKNISARNDREDIGKLGAKGDIAFFIGYSADSCAYRVYNRELDLLFEAMHDDYIGGQPSATARTVPPAQEPQDVDELNPNAMVDGNTFVNQFAKSSTSDAASSSYQNMDPSNMHTFYQPYPHEFQWTKDHPLEQVKENQENDKIRSKPDKNGKRVKAGKSLNQLHWVEEEKLRKT
nr:hypothetical protein [Tanacetum cinerariifolium]